jgi:serine/threonine-protein kinase
VLGKTLGSYKVVSKLGEGGMGAVYTATHPLIGRKAAVKVLLPQFSHQKEIVERFFNEARAATLIKHAGIIDIFDFGYADDGSAYIVMEFLDGESLTSRIQRYRQLRDQDVLRIARQMASALAAAHQAGIVHRDLKPDNIFLVPDAAVNGGERVKILDFGIAKLTGSGKEAISKTRTGTVMGSPQYMSPEQCRGAGDADARADIYAFGCVLYHMLCGRPPFDGTGAGEVMAKHIYEKPPPLSSYLRGLPVEVERLVMRCLEKKPQDRLPSMEAVIASIDALTRGRFSSGAAVPAYRTPPMGLPPAVPGGGQLAPTEPPGSDHRHYANPSTKPQGTTLQGSSGQLAAVPTRAPSGSRRPVVIAAASVLVAAAGAVVFLKVRSRDAPAESGGEQVAMSAPATPMPAPEPTPTPKPAAEKTEKPAAAPSAPVSPASAAATEKVTLEIESDPSADVQDSSGAVVGKTPFSVDLPRSSEHRVYLLSHSGYEPARVELAADKSRVERVVLREKKRGREHSTRRSRPTGAAPIAAEKKPNPGPGATGATPKEGKKEAGKKEEHRSGFGQTADPFE